jgi:hypothetical protein
MASGYFGKYTGIVKANDDDEKRGHLQLSVPALFPPDSWVLARAALPFGYYFVPENEAKVWVEFEGGESTLPLWTGLQYVPGEWSTHAQEKPPQKRVIETPAGHRIVFFDKAGDEAIEITEGKSGHVLKMDKNGITLTQGQKSTNLTFASGGVTLESDDDITLKAKGAITIEAGKALTITGKDTVTVETTKQLTAKGNPIHLNP